MRRMTCNDRNFWIFTLGPWSKTFSIILVSAGDDDEGYNPRHKHFNFLRFIGFGWALRIRLPEFIRPLLIKHDANWDEETVKRLGRNWYYEVYPREFGFSLSDMGNGYDFLQVFLGPQTHSSDTTKSWCTHLPWKEWTHVRHSLYKPDGSHFYTFDNDKNWFENHHIEEKCPACHFLFQDYDNERIIATCTIEEREWHKGGKGFRWLKYFSKPKIHRSLDLKFSEEVGPEKGSWKGGTLGHGIDMLPGEDPETAFRRYCEKDHECKGRKFRLLFLWPCGAPPPKPAPAPSPDNCANQACANS